MKELVIALLILISAGCSSYRVVRDQADNTANWSSYQTFTFIDTNRIDPSPRDTYQTAIEQVKQAVAQELGKRGYRQIPSSELGNQADLLVNIGGVINEKTQTRPTTIYEAPRYTGQQRYHWQSQEVSVGTYKEGTLSIHLVDARRNNLLWDAAVTSILKKGNVTSQQISEGISQLFTKFPGNRL